jgi:hypothetical protein
MFPKCIDLEMFLLVVNVSQVPLKVRGDGEAPGAQVTGVRLFACVSSEEIRETVMSSVDQTSVSRRTICLTEF